MTGGDGGLEMKTGDFRGEVSFRICVTTIVQFPNSWGKISLESKKSQRCRRASDTLSPDLRVGNPIQDWKGEQLSC